MDWFFQIIAFFNSIWNSIQLFFEKMGAFGLFLYSIFETATLMPVTELIQLQVSRGADVFQLFYLATIAVIGTEIGVFLVWGLMRITRAERLIRFVFRNDEAITKAEKLFKDNGDKTIIIAALTPIPYSLVLYVALAAKLSLKKALLSSLVSRCLRFYLVAIFLSIVQGIVTQDTLNQFITIVTIITTVVTIIGIISFLYVGKKKKEKGKKEDSPHNL